MQSIWAAISFSCSPYRIRIAFWTPPTPAWDNASGTSEGEAWRSCVRSSRGSAMDENATADNPFARLVSLACHDLRTPLATVVGFAHTLTRQGGLEEPAGRYVEMIGAAAGQLGELVDELSLGARIEAGRYDPVLKEVDSLELARSAAKRLGEERVVVEGAGATVELDVDASERAVAALAQCALRHGGLEQVRLGVRGAELTLAPVTPASAPVLLGEDLRDLGAAIAGLAIRAQGGEVELAGKELHVRLPGPRTEVSLRLQAIVGTLTSQCAGSHSF